MSDTVFQKITTQVSELTKREGVGDGIIGRVAEELAGIEIARRKALIVKAFQARIKADAELAKIQPDVVCCDDTGSPTRREYTQQKFAALKKAREALAKLDAAIESAVYDAKYDQLEKAVGGEQ